MGTNIESSHDDPSRTAPPGCAPGEIEPPEPKSLSAIAVWIELKFAVDHGLSFLGQSPSYWKELFCVKAQELSDEADPDEYDEWNVRVLEKGWRS